MLVENISRRRFHLPPGAGALAAFRTSHPGGSSNTFRSRLGMRCQQRGPRYDGAVPHGHWRLAKPYSAGNRSVWSARSGLLWHLPGSRSLSGRMRIRS
jgi:hypothetical protein